MTAAPDDERQPALPGAESVRDLDNPTPTFDTPYTLTAPPARGTVRPQPTFEFEKDDPQ